MALIAVEKPLRIKTVLNCNHCGKTNKHKIRYRKERDGAFHVGLYCANCEDFSRFIKRTPVVDRYLRHKELID